MAAHNRLNILNKKFGRLTVIDFSHIYKKVSYWQCKCDCGNTIICRGPVLNSGHTQSCGCLQKERATSYHITHGQTNTPEYNTWCLIKTRCHNNKFRDYPYYGGRGIKVCNRWLNSFENFLADMGKRPQGRPTLDRIDNNGPYSPENCRWTTRKHQTRNRRMTKTITYKGETKPLAQWAEELNMSYDKLYFRIHRGWSPKRALET